MVSVALLRGVNVGGKNRLPMRELASIFEATGCTSVRTYIQSGNVIFEAPPALSQRIPALVARELRERFGMTVPVVARAARHLHGIVERNPFANPGIDARHLHVLFLESKPAAAAVHTLDPDRSPPDRFAVDGREIYLCCPNGMARTKLTNVYFETKLRTTGTARNWNTVLRLLELV